MTHKEFEVMFNNANIRRWQLLDRKNKEYTRGDNRFQSFDEGAAFDSSSPVHELWHGLKKHLTSIKNLVRDDESDRTNNLEIWLEKLDDARNYLDLLEGLVRRKTMQ